MDGMTGFEMPSPKRVRLESLASLNSQPSPSLSDNMDDLYGISSASKEVPEMIQQSHTPIQEGLSPVRSTKPFFLPGLGSLNGQTTLSNDLEESHYRGQMPDASIPPLENGGQRFDNGVLDIGDGLALSPPESNKTEGKSDEIGKDTHEYRLSHTRKEDQSSSNPREDAAGHASSLIEQVPVEVGGMQSNTASREATMGTPEPPVKTEPSDFGRSSIEELPCEETSPNTGTENLEAVIHMDSVTQSNDDGNKAIIIDSTAEAVESHNAEITSPTFEDFVKADKSNTQDEFEIDSSPYQSSSSDVSSDTSSSDESSKDAGNDSDADDYEMLSPEEEARRLMAEDGGPEEKATSGIPRTLNEKPDEIVPKPEVSITGDMKLEELGCVENLVENLALIKATTSGEYQVLESGSVLCLEDRTVIGVVGETLGQVQQPYYTVRFTNPAAISEAGVSRDTNIFYVAQFATTVFTQPLKAYKGSDASNLHDEEIGDDELEFSDDEAEAEHKRQVKSQKRARYDAKHGQENGVFQPRHVRPQDHGKQDMNTRSQHPSHPTDSALNYDDAGEESDELYTPLARPANLHEMLPPRDGPPTAHRGSAQRGGRSRGRGDRGEGRGRGRGGRGSGRGGGHDRKGHSGSQRNGHSHTHPDIGPHPSTGSQSLASAGSSLPPRPPPQTNGSHSHPQPPQPPMPPPSYPNQSWSQPYSHTGNPPQNAPAYGHPYNYQYQQSQPNHSPYLPGSVPQGYLPPQTFSSNMQYPFQQTQQTPPSPAAIPPGAHINPNFFRQQAQNLPPSWQQR